MEHKDAGKTKFSGTTYGGIGSIESVLDELKDDVTVPKNVRLKIEKVIEVLNSDLEMQIKVSKALNELEEIADDVNLQSYTRTQIWNVVSILEKIK
jgi:hypothetical protein